MEPHRVYRGRVLAVLRDLPCHGDNTLPLRALGPLLHAGFADADASWLAGVVAGQQKDCLAVTDELPAYRDD